MKIRTYILAYFIHPSHHSCVSVFVSLVSSLGNGSVTAIPTQQRNCWKRCFLAVRVVSKESNLLFPQLLIVTETRSVCCWETTRDPALVDGAKVMMLFLRQQNNFSPVLWTWSLFWPYTYSPVSHSDVTEEKLYTKTTYSEKYRNAGTTSVV
jgi:hypothetical protein